MLVQFEAAMPTDMAEIAREFRGLRG
jgi:hypothetical protein